MKKPARKTVTYSLSIEAIRILNTIAEHQGISKSAVIELLVREESRKLGLE